VQFFSQQSAATAVVEAPEASLEQRLTEAKKKLEAANHALASAEDALRRNDAERAELLRRWRVCYADFAKAQEKFAPLQIAARGEKP
jgi:chromosome segregation ATPase